MLVVLHRLLTVRHHARLGFFSRITRLDSAGEKTADFFELGPFRAAGPRLLSVSGPGWYERVGVLPSGPHFTAMVEIFEQNRLMPSPADNKIKVTATAPKTGIASTWDIGGALNTAQSFDQIIDIQYP